jgi:MoxR-like ATPase
MKIEERVQGMIELVDNMTDVQSDDDIRVGDARDGAYYHHDERTRTALKVALITGRPLLLVGPSGCGKSSLAPYVARNLNLRLETYTVIEGAEPSDLLWRIDYLRRLNDAAASKAQDLDHYVERGVLWRAFEPEVHALPADDDVSARGTLVLIDEIDKADPGFANSLLVALGSLRFEVPPLRKTIQASPDAIIVVLLTSNKERALPPALMRRCVVLSVDFPSEKQLTTIARQRWSEWMGDARFSDAVSRLAKTLVERSQNDNAPHVSTAEFLDLVQVLRMWRVQPEDLIWSTIEGLVLLQSNVDA